MLFGDTPEQTRQNVADAASRGFRALKLGWGGYGVNLEQDIAHIEEARREAGPDISIMVDAGTIWACSPDPVKDAALRLPSLKAAGVTWLEEPFSSHDFDAYARLAELSAPVRLAGGEGSHTPEMALHMMRYAKLGFIQIDTGRIGGITPALEVAQACSGSGIQYVNHTFTTQLALSASLQPFAGVGDAALCEYPFQPSALAASLTDRVMVPDESGHIRLPEAPGLGISPNPEALRNYMVSVNIEVNGRILYSSPRI